MEISDSIFTFASYKNKTVLLILICESLEIIFISFFPLAVGSGIQIRLWR